MRESTQIQMHVAEVRGPSDRSFGFVFAAVFIVIGLYPLLGHGAMRSWALIVAGGFFVFAIFLPKVLAPANRLWMKIGVLLQAIVSPVAIGILFYFVILPTGVLMRLSGKDILRLRFDPAAKSYWIHRDPPGPPPESLNNQF